MIHYYKLLETGGQINSGLRFLVFGVTVQIIKISFGSDNEAIKIKDKY
jgi:hypothetical protein